MFDIAQFAKSTHVTPPERAAFQAFLDDGYVDVVRPHVAGPDGYTYWDYYRQRFERNRGMHPGPSRQASASVVAVQPLTRGR